MRTLRMTPVRFEVGARAHRPDDVYRSYLDQSDVFVGIYWESYGWVAPGATVSGIEDELERSRERPQLIYVKEPAPNRDPALGALLQRIREGALTTYRRFAAPGELSELVLDDLAVLLTERFQTGRAVARDLPEGTVTFVFVDLADSTRIAGELPGAYPAIVGTFQTALAETVGRHGGVVVDTEGDGAFCVFSTVDDAATAAVSFQRDVIERPWPDDVLVLARIGIHTGTAERTANNYVGLEVHRAARIGAAANGGQVLVSRPAANLLGKGSLDGGWQLADLGSFALKGLDRAEELLQLNAPGLPGELLAPRARGARTVHLPAELTALVGREDEIADAAQVLERHDVRLVTLTGPGGIGKTRLAVASAARAADAYPDGVFFVPLADTRTTDQVVGAIAAALGLRSEGARALLSTIEDRLASGRALLVLDNFEQVVESRTIVAQLLESCPGLELVVTSRTPLRIRGETELPVPPLRTPAAVRLFLERAPRPDWTPAADELEVVQEICSRLDGLPLAIELAAARMRILDPASLLERLSRTLDVVGGSVPDLPERQRTLTATIEWSYGLLDAAERALLARLAVFVGGWTLEAAENVCSGGVVSDALSALERLSEHSLLVAEPGLAGGPRMRMLGTIHEFAAARLEASTEAEALRERHASYYEQFIVELHAQPGGETATVSIERLDDDWDDVLACMEWRFRQDDYSQVVQIVSRTWRYLWLRDHFNELAPWLTAAYTARDTLEPALRGELCRLWGSGCYQAGMFEPARDAVEEAVRLLAETGPADREAWARTVLGGLLPYFDGDLDRPFAELSRAVELFRVEGNVFGLATTLGMRGTISLLLGRTDEAMSQLQDGMVLAEQLGLAELIGSHHSFRALAHLASDEIEAARQHLDAAVAAPLYLEGTAYCLEGYAAVLAAEGDLVLAATALGAAEGLRKRTGIAMWPLMNMILRDRLASLESAGPAAAAARFAGHQMSPAEALAHVRAG